MRTGWSCPGVRPVRVFRNLRKSAAAMGSRLRVGSSSSSTLGPWIMARARPRRCTCPVERVRTWLSMKVAIPISPVNSSRRAVRFRAKQIVHGGEELKVLAGREALVEAAVRGGVKPKPGADLRAPGVPRRVRRPGRGRRSAPAGWPGCATTWTCRSRWRR